MPPSSSSSSSSARMLQLSPQALLLCCSVAVSAQSEDSGLGERAIEVLKKQNLVTLGSVLAVLLLLMIFMAVCVYKPLPRR